MSFTFHTPVNSLNAILKEETKGVTEIIQSITLTPLLTTQGAA